jgi:hypothetical protein
MHDVPLRGHKQSRRCRCRHPVSALVAVSEGLEILDGCDTLLVYVAHGTSSQILIDCTEVSLPNLAAAAMLIELPTANRMCALQSLATRTNACTLSARRAQIVWRKRMKIVVLAVVSLALPANLVGQVTAAPLRTKKQVHRQHTMTKPSNRPPQRGGDYYEHLLDKVPFGSQRWWRIYHEQHGEPN